MAQFATFVLLVAALYLLVDMYRTVHEQYAPIPKITQTWETQPIVSVYVPDAEKAWFCKSDYERLSFRDEFAISFVTEGPCGCAMNSLSYYSTNAMCPTNVEKSDSCKSLRALPEVASETYRSSNICIKRGGEPAAIYHKSKYHARPSPDYFGACPAGHKTCGTICFPVTEQCPITDLIVLPAGDSVPVGQGWESAGVFPTGNVLYVRREQIETLPIVNIVARLAEMNALSTNVRGECYEGSSQTLHKPIVSDSNLQWSYSVDMPQRCEVVDLRYHLFDSIDLEEHFLDNVQDWVESCQTHELLPLRDPRYQAALDPDYLNSGIECGDVSTRPCVRDPLQHTDCAPDDNICNGVVNQNICGAYAHAVRSAFAGSSATLGLYFMREIDWSSHCSLGKDLVFAIPDNLQILSLLYWMLIVICVYIIACFFLGKLNQHHLSTMMLSFIVPLFWHIQVRTFPLSFYALTPTSVPFHSKCYL